MKNQIKKTVLVILVATGFSLSLVACDSGSGGTGEMGAPKNLTTIDSLSN